MPTGVDVPHVGHRTAPGCRLSPHVEQRIDIAVNGSLRLFVPTNALLGRFMPEGPESPYQTRMILTRNAAPGNRNPPASPPRRTVVVPPATEEGLTR